MTKNYQESQHVIDKRLYSLTEATAYLGRTECAVRGMLYAGKLPFVGDGKRMLLDIRDMDAWIKKNWTQFEY